MPHTAKHSQLGISQEGESDTEFGETPLALQFDKSQPDLLKQFEQLLTKALKHTSDTITKWLTQEIRDLGHHTTTLEQRAEEVEILTHNHSEELEALHEENLSLQARLEDFESRARRSNIHIRRIPETVTDLLVH